MTKILKAKNKDKSLAERKNSWNIKKSKYFLPSSPRRCGVERKNETLIRDRRYLNALSKKQTIKE